MDVVSYGWVANQKDLVAWENGMKWLSKAIVSDRSEAGKAELKDVLEIHLKAACAHPDREVKEIGVFYCLAWKRFDLVDRFWRELGAPVMRELLLTSVGALFANYGVRYFDLSLLIFEDRERTVCSVRDFIENRIVSPTVVRKIAALFFSHDRDQLGIGVKSVSELVSIFGVDAEIFDSFFDSFLALKCPAFHEALVAGNIAWCEAFLEDIEPLRQFFLKSGRLVELYECVSLLPSVVDSAKLDSVLALLLRWNLVSEVALRFNLKKDGDKDKEVALLHSLLLEYYSDRELTSSCVERFARFIVGGGALVLEGLLVRMASGLAEHDAMYEYFNHLFESQDASVLLEAHFCSAFLIKSLEIEDQLLERARHASLGLLWKQAAISASKDEWRQNLLFFGMLADLGVDRYIEDEYLLPLMREGLHSTHHFVHRAVLYFAREKAYLNSSLVQWLSAAHTQFELTEPLFVYDVKKQIAALNRLVTIFFRVEVCSEYLIKRLNMYQANADKHMSGTLQKRVFVVIERLKVRLGAQRGGN